MSLQHECNHYACARRPNDTIIDARRRFWVVDRRGLVVRGRGDADLLPDQVGTVLLG